MCDHKQVKRLLFCAVCRSANALCLVLVLVLELCVLVLVLVLEPCVLVLVLVLELCVLVLVLVLVS